MSKWIELETDASTGKPYLWKCDECGEEVETRWNYCPECGDPKTSKGKNINTLVKALEAEHRKLREMQSATDKNVGTTDTISRQAAIDYFVTNVGFHDEDGYPIEDEEELREIWTGYFDGIPPAESEKRTEERTETHACDCISKQAAITQLSHNKNKGDDEWELAVENDIQTIWKLPPAQPIEDIHREKEQAYYCGYEDGAKAARKEQRAWKWILGDMCSVKGYWATCSVCGHTSFGGGNFCRECGAKMGGNAE